MWEFTATIGDDSAILGRGRNSVRTWGGAYRTYQDGYILDENTVFGKSVKVRVFLMRHRGRALSRRDADGQMPLLGNLQLATTHYRGVGSVPQLELRNPNDQSAAGCIATLYYPDLERLGHGVLYFRGLESVNHEEGKQSFAQFWRCELILG